MLLVNPFPAGGGGGVLLVHRERHVVGNHKTLTLRVHLQQDDPDLEEFGEALQGAQKGTGNDEQNVKAKGDREQVNGKEAGE